MNSRDWERRTIAACVMILVAVLALRPGTSAQTALSLAFTVGLLSRIVAFYFPLRRRESDRERRRAPTTVRRRRRTRRSQSSFH
jgi:hypothetical protein